MSLADLIAGAASANNQIRAEAEKKLVEGRDNNPGLFILACSEEFSQKNLSDDLRPRAAVLIKYTLLNFGEGADKLWMNLDPEIRSTTKNNILGTLASPNDPIRNTAADLISIIYSIEASKGEWQDLIPNLAKNTDHNEVEIKKSAILTLGQICDKIKDKNLFTSEVVENILMGICCGMRPKERDDIKKIAVQALHDSLGFVKGQFEKKEIRSFVIDLLLSNCEADDIDLKTKALQCLIDYVKIYYETIGDYLARIWEITSPCIINKRKEIAVPAIEVWNTIAIEDKERASGKSEGRNVAYQRQSLSYISQLDNVLVVALLENLLDKDKYEDDDDGGEFTIIAATKSCLSSIAEAIKNKYLDYAIKFVGTYILSNTALEKRAALVAYTSMLEGPNYDQLSGLITQALPTMINLLNNDNNIFVREAAATALEATAELTPQVYFQDPLFFQIVPELTKGIDSPPKVSLHISKLWHFLGEQIAKTNADIDLSTVIDVLLKNSFRNDLDEGFYLLIDHSLLAVMTLLHATINDTVKEKYVVSLVEEFKKTGHVGGERRNLIQAGLLACLQTLLHRYSFKEDVPIIDEIYQLIMAMFEAIGDITADGVLVLGALASSMENKFKKYSQTVWPLVAKGISNTTQPEVFVASLGTLVELSRSCPDETANYLGEIFNLLIGLLNNASFDKNLKLSIIITIGDISLGCRDLVTPFIAELMEIYQMAMNAASVQPADGNTDLLEYVEQLRENLLESYICFLHAVAESQNSQALLNTMPDVMTYLTKTCTEQYNPTVDYMRNALALVADIGFMFGNKVANLVKSDFTVNLIRVLEKFQNNADNQAMVQYAKKVLNQI